MTRGVVKFFKAEKGWGAVIADDLPPGQDVFVHFSAIEATGYRDLTAGDVVDVDYVRASQDSFNYSASRVRRLASGPAPTLRRIDGKVMTVPDGTPDTPLMPRRQR